MNNSPTDTKLIVAFYGPSMKAGTLEPLKEWISWNADLCKKLGIKLTHIDAAFKGEYKNLKEDTPYDINEFSSRIEEQINKGVVSNIGINSLFSNPNGYISYDWDFTAALGERQRFGAMALIGIDMKYLSTWNKGLLQSFIGTIQKEVATRMTIVYGFCVMMPRKYFPSGYATGIMAQGVPEDIIHDTSSWRRSGRSIAQRVLRNVFGYNLVGPAHIEIDVGGVPLQEWIHRDKARGLIKKIEGTDLHCWTFQETTEGINYLEWDYEPVKAVRDNLAKAKIFPWTKG